MLLRLLWCIALSSGFSAAAVVAWAQSAAESWPAKPVSMVVPYSPGGSSELEARLYANKLTEIMGKPFVLDFKPGAGTVLGTNFAAKAPPDGHTIIAVTATYGGLPAAYPDLPFDPLNDLAPGRTPPAIIARLNTELLKVARSPDIIQKLGEDGNTMVGSTPEQFRKLIASEIAVTRRMVKETGITPGN